MTTLSHSGSKSSVHLSRQGQAILRRTLASNYTPTAFYLDSYISCAPLSHSGSIVVSNVLHSSIMARSLSQMCSTLAFWLDFNQHLQIPISLKIASVFSRDLHPASIWPASSQNLASNQPASSQHPASIQPASSWHPSMRNKLCYSSFRTQSLGGGLAKRLNIHIYIWQPEMNYKKVRGDGAKSNF
jgi:hypothetical protein